VKIIESFVIAVNSLYANKLRSALTMLGIIIGVGAVITLMAVGQGAKATITSTFSELGSNVVFVQPRNPEAPGAAGLSPVFATPSLTLSDAEAIAELLSVLNVAATNENFVDVVVGDEHLSSVIEGSTPAFLNAYGYKMATGEFISDRNVATRDMVVVLGSNAAKELFESSDPIGQAVKLKNKRFTVIGVLEAKGGALFGFSMDDVVVVPITTYQSRLFTGSNVRGESAVQSIAVQIAAAENIELAKEDIETLLRKRHRITSEADDDFAVVSQEQILGVLSQITGIFTIFLGAIASISLLVGSIGIMNIMLVSVTERTREIGIRKAVGAKRRDILLQFLLEAAMLSSAGGAIGIAGGWLVSFLISQIDISGTTLRAVVSPDIVLLAVSVSFFIGITSGMYPAMRAARLNPIDALRYG